jgi:hypothetical protein
MRGRVFHGAVLGMAVLASSAHAAEPNAWPAPGDYRIDSDTTTTSRAGGTTVQRLQHVDGSTGHITVTLRDSLSKSAPVTQTDPGQGPNKWCVPSNGAAPPAAAAAMSVGGVEERWNRIDERTWERSIRSVQTPTASPGTGSGAIELAMAGMSPEQRAAVAGSMQRMPSAADRAAAMAPVIAGLEKAARGSNAQEAAMAKEQLAMLRGSTPADGSGTVVVESKERWTRVAESCRPN